MKLETVTLTHLELSPEELNALRSLIAATSHHQRTTEFRMTVNDSRICSDLYDLLSNQDD